MADVKWIKIMTDIFSDDKILLIEGLPSADSIIVIWFKLLCLAGQMNNNGVFIMNNRLAYTDEMLASIFRRDVNTVRLALDVFQMYGMIEIVDSVITIPNWNKHQTLDSYEAKKERDRIYQRERRAKQKALIEVSDDCKTIPSSDVAISEEDIEEDKEKEIDINIIDSCESMTPKEVRHKYGEYKNVLLTDKEVEKLKEEFPDWEKRVDNLSYYIKSTGKRYKDYVATIRNWARKEENKKPVQNVRVTANQFAEYAMSLEGGVD